MYGCLFVALGLILAGQCEAQCESQTTHVFTGTVNIPGPCATYKWRFDATVATDLFIQTTNAFLNGQDYCKVYEGMDSTGRLLGQIDQYQIGPVLCNCSQLFVDCKLDSTGLIRMQANENIPINCGTTILTNFNTRISSQFPQFYSDKAVCIWEYQSPERRKFEFYFEVLDYESGSDFIFIIPDDNNSPRVRETGNHSFPFEFTTEGNSFRIITTSDSGVSGRGFQLDITEGPPENPDINCKEEIRIKLDDAKLADLTYESGDVLYISNTRQNDLGTIPSICQIDGSSPEFTFNLTQCGATYAGNDKHLNITIIVWNFKAMDLSHSIQRYVSHSLTIICNFNASYELHSVNIKPEIQETGTAVDPIAGEFEVSLTLYNDSGLNSVLGENSNVIVPDYIFAKVMLDNIPSGVEEFIVQAEECWATQSDNSSSALMYPIIENGCKAPPSGSEPVDAKEIIQNYVANCARFKFKSFVWTNFTDNEQNIYVHCDITICQNSTGLCPGKVCMKRKRRAVGDNSYRRLSAGPIRLAKSENYDNDEGEQDEKIFNENDETPDAVILFVAVLSLIIFCVVTLGLAKKY